MTTLDAWQQVTQSPAVVQFFAGLFNRAGVRVVDRNEAFTCVHHGNRIDFEPTLDTSTVDFTVNVTAEQVDRLAEHARGGSFDQAEQFRIASVLLAPASEALQRHPKLSNGLLRRLLRVGQVTHVYLQPPTGVEPPTTHTQIHVGGQWLVIPGLHGRPDRVLRLTVERGLAYHRRLVEAIQQDSWGGWIRFLLWRRQWLRSLPR